MEGRLILLAGATLVLASVAVSACGGAAPAPTPAPAAPAAAPTSAVPIATTAPTAAASADSGTAAELAASQAVFDQNCNACHPGGNRGVGPALKERNLSADRITGQVRKGGGSMPAFSTSQISDQQLNNLVAYVQSLK